MALIGVNGGLVGSRRVTSLASAPGLWTSNEQVLLTRASLWPSNNPVASHSWSTAGSTTSLNNRLGFRFTVGAASITCQSLGVYLPTGSLIERVTIHRVDTGASIVTTDITSSANAWVDAAVTPVVLSSGVQYVISSRSTTGAARSVYLNPTGLTFASAIGTINYRSGTSDAQPTDSTGNAYVFARFAFV